MQTSKPALELLTSDAIYRENPTALFHQLCGARPATLLLESADIDSKDDLKSLLLVDSAERPEDIDRNRAEAARIRAEERLQHKQSMHEYYQSKIALDRAMQRLQTAAKYKR